MVIGNRAFSEPQIMSTDEVVYPKPQIAGNFGWFTLTVPGTKKRGDYAGVRTSVSGVVHKQHRDVSN
jgi:hypothetical protein